MEYYTMRGHVIQLLVIVATCLTAAPAAHATWSIIIVDTQTKEVAIGSATCLANFDLRVMLPVVRVNLGAGAAQSYVDLWGVNRRVIWDELGIGTDPSTILDLLETQDPTHQTRQYGIVDTSGRAVTFSGSQNGYYANGLTGQIDNLVYAIQGNVITGQPVLDWAEAAVRDTPGDLADKLMVAMEEARRAGGDGRCSCRPNRPTSCGSPPPSFEKAAHVGFVIVARRGDRPRGCNSFKGCADGDYFLKLNVVDGNVDTPDPVFTLREQFDAWRTAKIGEPDAVQSRATIADGRLLNDGVSATALTIELLDWQGAPAGGIQDLEVIHDNFGSAGSSAIAAPIDLGGGVYEVGLTAGTATGLDVIRVLVTYDTGAVILLPSPSLYVQDRRGDLNGDGVVDLDDLWVLLISFGAGDGGDINGDGATDLTDLGMLLLMPGLT